MTERNDNAATEEHGELSRGQLPGIISVVLFDFDGTIADTIELILASFRHATKEVLGRVPPDEELLANVGRPLEEQMTVFDPERYLELSRVYREHNRRHHDEMARECPDAGRVLKELKRRGYRLGLVTSKGKYMIDRGLELFGWRHFFPVVICAEDTKDNKPNPEPVLEALRRLGASPEEAVYVGDSPVDVEAGNRAGVATIAALYGPFDRRAVQARGPAASIESIDELLELLPARG